MSPVPVDDLDYLLRHTSSDDPAVIETMVLRYHPAVVRLAISILGDPDEAADAAQETLIRAALKLDQYQPGTNFRAWLYAIALNTCRGQLRKRKAQQALHRLLAGALLQASRQPGPEEAAERAENRAEIWAAIDALDDKHRLPILLRIVHQIPVREVAQILDIREKTVYTRLYTAFRHIRAHMARLEARSSHESSAPKSF